MAVEEGREVVSACCPSSTLAGTGGTSLFSFTLFPPSFSPCSPSDTSFPLLSSAET